MHKLHVQSASHSNLAIQL